MNDKYIRAFKIDIMMGNDNGLHSHLLDIFGNLNMYCFRDVTIGKHIYFGKSHVNCYLMYNDYSVNALIHKDVWHLITDTYKLSFDYMSSILTYFIKDLYPLFYKVNYIGWSKHFDILNMKELEFFN